MLLLSMNRIISFRGDSMTFFARIAAAALAIALPLSLTAQMRPTDNADATKRYSPQMLADLARLRDAAMKSDYAYHQLAHLTENIGPRLTGSAQANQAVDYVAAELRKLGADVRTEEVMVPHWVRGVETGEVVAWPGQAPGTTQKLVLTALRGSTATPAEGMTGEIVAVSTFDELQALGRKGVEGKIVVFNHPFDTRMAAQGFGLNAYGQAVGYRAAAAGQAAKLGATAALIRSAGGAQYRLAHTGWSLDAPIPAACLAAEDAEMLAHLASQGPVRVHFTLTPQLLPDVKSYNVIADIKGSEHPEQIVIVSGHLDSWDLGTGAIDDGAGVVVAMQTANLIQQLGLHPRRTIRVIAWMDEETGGTGNKAYQKAHASEVANHVGAIETDLGAGHPIGFYINGTAAARAVLEPMSEVLQAIGAGILQPSEGSGADIEWLSKAGAPTFAPMQDSRTYFDYHHTAADTLDKVNPQNLAENAAVAAVLAYTLADLPEPLPR